MIFCCEDCVGKEVEETVNGASGGQVVLLENLRFHAEEGEGSSKDAEGKKVKADKGERWTSSGRELTALGDVYIECVEPASQQNRC